MLKLDSPIQQVKGVGAKYAALFHKAGILTVLDLLFHFPSYYINFADAATTVTLGVKQLYRVEVVDWNVARLYHKRLSLVRVKAKLGEQIVAIVFFNQPYLADFFKSHHLLYIYGQFELENGTLQANTPAIFSADDPNRSLAEPVYTKIATIKSGKLKQLIQSIFPCLEDTFENLPAVILQQYQFPRIVDALVAIHLPLTYNPEQLEAQKRRFIYSEFLFFQLELQFIRDFFKQVPRLFRYPITASLRERVVASLPFTLTPDQESACADIIADLSGDYTMQRLLQGGCG